MRNWQQYQEFVTELHGKAGDAIIFCEACTHGTLPWMVSMRHFCRPLLVCTQRKSVGFYQDTLIARSPKCDAGSNCSETVGQGARQRRAVLYKYNTGHMAWGGVGGAQPPYYSELSIEQKAALEPPGHHSRRAKQSNDYKQLRDRLAAEEVEADQHKL